MEMIDDVKENDDDEEFFRKKSVEKIKSEVKKCKSSLSSSI